MLILKKGGTSMRGFACPCAHHKDIWGPGSTVPFILKLDTTWTEWSAVRPCRSSQAKSPGTDRPSKRLKPMWLNI